MAHVRQANRFGKAEEVAGNSAGYTASGEGEYSRKSAHAKHSFKFSGRGPRKTPGKHSLDELITECERRLEWTECELKCENDPQRRIKLTRDLEIRGKFLTRLLIEREALR